jgi:hypothetical protein
MLGRVSSTDYADYTDASGAGGVAADGAAAVAVAR